MLNLDIDKLSESAEGREQIVKSIAKISINPSYRKDVLTSWQYYYGKQNADVYDYLLKTGNELLPAVARFFPVQRGYINLLVSTFDLRPIIYSVNACNRDAVKNKYDNRLKEYVREMMARAKMKNANINANVETIQMQLQQLTAVLERTPQNEEEAAQMQMLKTIIPQIKSQMISAIEMSKTESLFTRREIEKIERYYMYDKKDLLEELSQKTAKKLRENFNMKKLGRQAFMSKIVAGNTFFYVDYDIERNKLIYEVVNSLKVTYPNIENIEWVHKCPWVKISEMMSGDSIINTWGHKLSEKQKNSIRAMTPANIAGEYSDTFLALPGGYVMDIGVDSNINSGDFSANNNAKSYGSGISVEKIWWTAQKEINAIQSVNPHRENAFFTHFCPEGKIIISSDDYRYDFKNKVYIHKKTNKKVEKEKAMLVNEQKGDKIVKRYYDVRYRGVIINNEIVIAEKDPIQPRSNDDYATVPLPVVGPTYNSITDMPYSLMMITKALADTYNLLHLHREIILALSGVVGILIDISQKPDSMSREEWFHQMKLGRYLIQTVQHGRQVSSFNQFNTFDMSFSSSIQYIDNMIYQTDQSIGDIMGISPPRKGDIRPHDQVGTQYQSKIQSELRTEIYFIDYEDIEQEAFSMLMNLWSKYIASSGQIMELIGEDNSYEYLEIQPKMFDNIDFSVKISNSRKNEDALHELKVIAKQYTDQGRLPFYSFINMYFAESIIELRKMAEYYDRSITEAMQEAQKEQLEAHNQTMKQVESMKSELQMKLKQIEVELKEKEIQLKTGIEENKAYIEKAKLDFEKKKWDDEKQIKMLEIAHEEKTESGLIQESKESRTANQQLKAIELKINSLINIMKLQLEDRDGINKHGEAIKKLDLQEKQTVKKRAKEHLIDN